MSNIEWTNTTWNPVIGCTPVSPGCLNCYAATMARRLEAMGRPEYAVRGLETARGKVVRIAEVRGGRAVFTGEVRCLPERLTEPLHWKRPRMVFVNSMSDLFHEAVPFEFIGAVHKVIAAASQHQFQVLTKRPERAVEFYKWLRSHVADVVYGTPMVGGGRSELSDDGVHDALMGAFESPLPNLWLGTSVEDQDRANERVPHLMRCPAAVRFLSCEPLLGAVDLDACGATPCDAVDGFPDTIGCPKPCPGVNWVIVGGESGPHARPCDVAWIRSIVRQCREAGVPCFVKQLGSVPMNGPFRQQPVTGKIDSPAGGNGRRFVSRKGADPAEWPEDLRVRQFPEVRR